MRRALAVTALAGLLAAVPLTARSAPTCTTEGTEAACGGRVVAEPLTSATFLQYGLETEPVLRAIEKLAPGIVEVRTLAEWTGDARHTSAGGRKLWVARLTDEGATGEKQQVVASLSVHGNESAGREGGIRYLEDVARWWQAGELARPLYSGDHAEPLAEVLARTELYLAFLNPDGWAKGDLVPPGGGVFDRRNANNVDLNRQFPTIGWTQLTGRPRPLTQPEAVGWDAFVSSLPNLKTATDIHGELTSANKAFADLMWPAGQWSPRRQAQELQLGVNMIRSVERKFQDDKVILELLKNGDVQRPANAATAYDVVGYDDSGFMGDWLAAKGAVEIDVENFLSHIVPSNVWLGALEQAHVAAVRGILEATVVEALITDAVQPSLDLGRVGYVVDPVRVRSDDANGFGFTPPADITPQPYDVSRMRYFEDLARDAGTPVEGIASADVATTDLSRLDSLVLADVAMPADPAGRPVDATAYVQALDRFVRGGGQLVVTDAAAQVLVDLGLFSAGDVKSARTNAGHVDFGARTHPWEQDLFGKASQTYYEVPLGFPATGSAPHWGVATPAWEARGGTSVGTVTSGSTSFTALGELPVGAGRVALFGAVLPTQNEAAPHLFGLADYGVTIAGGQVLHAILSYERPGRG